MSKLIYAMSVSLDGYIEDANGDFSRLLVDEEIHQHFNDLEASIDLILYGRRLYELMAAYWPTADEDPSAPEVAVEYAKIWREKPKVVFSKTLKQVGWNSRLVSDNMEEEVKRLKAQEGNLLSVGGADLAGSLMELGLIDEIRLYISPIIFGGGKPMIPHLREKVNLKLIETHTFGSGVVLLRYQCVK